MNAKHKDNTNLLMNFTIVATKNNLSSSPSVLPEGRSKVQADNINGSVNNAIDYLEGFLDRKFFVQADDGGSSSTSVPTIDRFLDRKVQADAGVSSSLQCPQ